MSNEGHDMPRRTPAHRNKYQRIADDLRFQIEMGEIAPGEPLPSLSDIAKSNGVAMNVARAAIDSLKKQGLLDGGQGKRPTVRVPRTRVTRSNQQHHKEKERVLWPEKDRRKNGPLEDTTGISLDGSGANLTATYSRVEATDAIPEYPEGMPLLRREYRTLDKRGQLIAWSISWLPVDYLTGNPSLFDSSNEPWPGATQHQLHTVGIEVAKVVDTITARAPSSVEFDEWGMRDGEPLICGRDVMYDTKGRIVSVSVSQYPAERTQLEFVTPLPERGK